MKPLGIILVVVGILALLIGLVKCFTTLTSDYASSACVKAEADKSKFAEAKRNCGDLPEYSKKDCLDRETVGLTTQDDCESRKSFMTKQLIMGIVPAVIGGLLMIIGFIVFIVGRKRAVT